MPGMAPGSLISQCNLRDLGLTSEALTQQGIRDYNATIPTVSGTQTVSPALQTQIAETNALNAAAPTPALAQNYAQQLYNQYLNAMRGPGTGTTGRPSPAAGIPTSTYQPSIPTSTGTSPYYSPQTGGQAGSGTGTGFLTDPSGNQWNANGTVTTPDGYNWTASDLSTFGTDLADVYGFNWGSGNAAQNTSNVGASSGSTYDSSYDPYAYDASSYDYGYDSSYDPYSEF